jgi:hypothetical protein
MAGDRRVMAWNKIYEPIHRASPPSDMATAEMLGAHMANSICADVLGAGQLTTLTGPMGCWPQPRARRAARTR